jgi:hypothetical protein
MDESLDVISQIRTQLIVANRLVVIKELYGLGIMTKERYVELLRECLENN